MPFTGEACRRIYEPINVVHECLLLKYLREHTSVPRLILELVYAGPVPRLIRTHDLVQSLGFQLERDVPDSAQPHPVADLIEHPLVMGRVVQNGVSAERYETARERPYV